jgi:hypothetical protein
MCQKAGMMLGEDRIKEVIESPDEVKITERGWPGHYILGDRCVFHRNTLVEAENDAVIVSTVGNLRSMDGERRMERVGAGLNELRWYETMVFGVLRGERYVDMNVDDERHPDEEGAYEWAIYAKTIEDLPEDVDNVANDMHEAAVAWWTEKLKE